MTETNQTPAMDFDSLPTCEIGKGLAGLDFPAGNAVAGRSKLTAAEESGLGTVARLERTTSKRYFYDLSGSKKAAALIDRLPAAEESFHCLMGGDFHGFDLLIAIRDLADEPAQRLTISTLGFNRHNVSHLCGMIDAGYATDVALLCSEYFRDSDRGTYAYAEKELRARGAQLGALRNHTKIACFQFAGRAFVVESSANLRSCNNIEQFALTNSQPLHDFHAEWIRRILSK